jgi:hypothetical protein
MISQASGSAYAEFNHTKVQGCSPRWLLTASSASSTLPDAG